MKKSFEIGGDWVRSQTPQLMLTVHNLEPGTSTDLITLKLDAEEPTRISNVLWSLKNSSDDLEERPVPITLTYKEFYQLKENWWPQAAKVSFFNLSSRRTTTIEIYIEYEKYLSHPKELN